MTDLIVVREGDPFELEIHPGAIPTPRLASEGRGEAYFVPSTPGVSDRSFPGVWYLHVPGSYEAKDGQYTRVRVLTK